MKCYNCPNENATNKITMMEGISCKEVYLCDECLKTMNMADVKGFFPTLMAPLMEHPEKIEEIIEDMVKHFKKSDPPLKPLPEDPQSCMDCYELFRTFMIPMLNAIHKTYHVPREARKQVFKTKIDEYRAKIHRAIKLEKYEEAAQYRDELAEYRRNIDESKPIPDTPQEETPSS